VSSSRSGSISADETSNDAVAAPAKVPAANRSKDNSKPASDRSAAVAARAARIAHERAERRRKRREAAARSALVHVTE